MADAKMSALGTLTSGTIADADFFLLVDASDTTMAATGTNKTITSANALLVRKPSSPGSAYTGGDQTGNARGANAMDFQSERSAVTQVASGASSVTFGSRNTAAGTQSVALGYGNNSTSAGYNVCAGYGNTASAASTTAIGCTNTASSANASAVGRGNTASGGGSVAVGRTCIASASNASAFGNSVDNSTANSTEIGSSDTNKIRISSAGLNLGLFACDIILDTTTGTKIGTATSQKLAFYNATPIVQGASVADASGGATIDAEARAAVNAVISRLEALGLIATV